MQAFISILIVLFTIITAGFAVPFDNDPNSENSGSGWTPFRSSNANREIAEREYPNSPLERFVAESFGDELPRMRDDLIERKENGEGFLERHAHAWTNWDNWKVDPDNNEKEKNN